MVLAETEDIWGEMFQESGLQYTEPRLVLFAGQTSSACGFAQSAMGPFYCPNDQTVYLDIDFFRVMQQQLGSQGEFARAYVIAHEVGHHVQDELGAARAGQRPARPRSSERAVERAVGAGRAAGRLLRRDLGATRSQERLQLTEDDIRSALDTAARIGDDALQRASQGCVVPDSFTHGSSEQRQDAGSTTASAAATRSSATPSRRGHLMGELVNLRTARKQRDRADGARGEAATRDGDAARGRAAARRGRARAAAARRPPARRAGVVSWPGRPEKHSLTLKGHRTSVSLEPEFWRAFRDDRRRRGPAAQRARRRDRRGARRRPRPRLGDPGARAGLVPRTGGRWR